MTAKGRNEQCSNDLEVQLEPSNSDAPKDAKPADDDAPVETVPMRDMECPPELPPLAREEWNRVVGELIALGVLSKFDRGPLAIYCGAYAAWAEATAAMHEYGVMIKSPSGFPIQSPYVAIVNRQADLMLKIANEFGFTPGSRSRNFSYTKSRSMLIEASEEPVDEPKPLSTIE
jgi:P27 family predicted phage terminase small subunit